jgi:flagellar assembly protein FliH
MSIAHLLEEFGNGMDPEMGGVGLAMLSTDAVETARLEAYEEGYKAGWDDAIGANTSEKLQLSADLSQNLRDMAFTYQEAVAHVTRTLGGVFDGMLTHFLPEAAKLALAPKVLEVIAELPLQPDTMPLTIAVAEENLKIMQKVALAVEHESVDVIEDPDLTGGQVSLRFGPQEVAVDFDALLDELREALAATLPTLPEEASHG